MTTELRTTTPKQYVELSMTASRKFVENADRRLQDCAALTQGAVVVKQVDRRAILKEGWLGGEREVGVYAVWTVVAFNNDVLNAFIRYAKTVIH